MRAGDRDVWFILAFSAIILTSGCATDDIGKLSWSNPFADRKDVTARYEEPVDDSPKKPVDEHALNLAYARLMTDIGNLADARQKYQAALEANPKSIDAKLGMAHVDQLLGKNEQAEANYREVLRTHPNSPQALFALGKFYTDQRRWSEGLPLLKQAMIAAPGEEKYRYTYGISMAKSGDTEGALPLLVNSVGEALAHYNIGYVLQEEGKLEQAESHLLIALELQPSLNQAEYWLDEVQKRKSGPRADRSLVARQTRHPGGAVHHANRPLDTQGPRIQQSSAVRRSATLDGPISGEGLPRWTGQESGQQPAPTRDGIPNWPR